MNWVIGFVLELALFASPLWKIRKLAVYPVVLLVLLGTYELSGFAPPALAIMLWAFTIIRVFNLLRVVMSRVKPHQLRETGGVTAWSLFMYQFAVVVLYVLIPSYQLFWWLIIGSQLILAIYALVTVRSNISKLKFEMPKDFLTDKELPTLTIAIPARNETEDLERCLKTVLASDYPKLEVLVLDDCSQKKASSVIKGLSHKGVRFLKGRDIEDGWLAKNQAYQDLYKEASGNYILFCGVDVRFNEDAFRAIVNLLTSRSKAMLSIMPFRKPDKNIKVNLFQPMRYWWELALPRRQMNRPAVLSTCWVIEKRELRRLGGFGSVRNSISPERVFAKQLITDDSYSFVRSSGQLLVETVKSLPEQKATAIRTRYPLLGQNLENVLLYSFFQLFLFFTPLVFLSLTLLGVYNFSLLPILTVAILTLTHVAILRETNPVSNLIAIITFPVAIVTDIALNFVSMYKYEFGKVEWKDRNICLPVLKTYPKLPKLED